MLDKKSQRSFFKNLLKSRLRLFDVGGTNYILNPLPLRKTT